MLFFSKKAEIFKKWKMPQKKFRSCQNFKLFQLRSKYIFFSFHFFPEKKILGRGEPLLKSIFLALFRFEQYPQTCSKLNS